MSQLQAPTKDDDGGIGLGDTPENDFLLDSAADNVNGVLIYGGKKYAAGLMWLAGGDIDIDSGLAQERANQLGADFYAVRSTIANQQGFGFLSMGHKTGMPAAAAIAADSLVGEWHGMFPVDNGWWYVAVHSDAVAPDGDRLFEGEEEALAFFKEQTEDYEWPRSFAPEEWDVPGASGDVPLEQLLDDVDTTIKLKPVNLDAILGGKGRKLFVGVILLGLLIAFAGLVATPGMIDKIMVDRVQYHPKVAAPSVIEPPPREPQKRLGPRPTYRDIRVPRPSSVANLCSESLEQIVLPIPGWDMSGMGCIIQGSRLGVADASWRRRLGSMDMIKSFVDRFPPEADVEFNGRDLIVVRMGIEDLFRISQPIRVISREEAIQILANRFGELGVLQIRDVVPPPPPPPPPNQQPSLVEQQPRVQQEPPFLEVTLMTGTPPNVLGVYFDIPGLKLENIVWAPNAQNSWTYKAQLLFESELLEGQPDFR